MTHRAILGYDPRGTRGAHRAPRSSRFYCAPFTLHPSQWREAVSLGQWIPGPLTNEQRLFLGMLPKKNDPKGRQIAKQLWLDL